MPIKVTFRKGGTGSGHHGHAGRPGKRGGSLPGSGSFTFRDLGQYPNIRNAVYEQIGESPPIGDIGIEFSPEMVKKMPAAEKFLSKHGKDKVGDYLDDPREYGDFSINDYMSVGIDADLARKLLAKLPAGGKEADDIMNYVFEL